MSDKSFVRLTAAQTPDWLAAHPGALVLDAREARHHDAGHLPGSLRLDGRNHEMLLLREKKSRPVFIYCYHGNSSQTYAQMFADFGFADVADLIGGYEAWAAQAPAKAPNHAIASWLADHGFAHEDAHGAHGNTPLMYAAWRGEAAVVEALLAHGVRLDAINGDGNNALWLACVNGAPALIRRLVEAGVPIDHVNFTGATALMYAASASKPEVVKTLLELGADAALKTQDDFTALDMAASVECLRLLRRAA